MLLRIGTRRSPLALAQAREVAGLLEAQGHGTEIVPMTTAGDRGAPSEDSPQGVKGLFVAEITDAVLAGDVHLAVHSAKDLPAQDPRGVVVAAVPERNLPYDVAVTGERGLVAGSVVGTSSLRRRAQLLRSRPELEVADIRGNVDTRLGKLDRGEVDGLILAAAGLARLGITPLHVEPLPLDEMVPAPGQGALAIHARAGGRAAAAAEPLDHAPSRAAFEAERGLVAALEGGCRLPLGAYVEDREGHLRMLAVVIAADGSRELRSEVRGEDPAAVAAAAADELLSGGAGDILAAART